MNVRSQISMVFHLDKCIGCHTCSIACKNIWTDRKGAEYMWWNNVETKPGTGYPTRWEDQEKYKGGFEKKNGKLNLKLQGRAGALGNIFLNPNLPTMDDYYEPWTYDYQHLFDAPEGDDQPTARAIPACAAACPAGAIYKRGEDGIVLLSQEKCRAWRMCISGCPYKKTYFNWATGKSEKCILCYPRLESGQPPACFHACVGRIRYLGVLLYDADQIEKCASVPDEELVAAQRAMIMDPFDPEVIKSAKTNGISDAMIASAQNSPVYKFVKRWGLALPLHPDFRTLPMLYYVPPMLPVLAKTKDGKYDVSDAESENLPALLSSLERARMPIKYMASMFSAGNVKVVEDVYRKLIAVRIFKRAQTVKDYQQAEVDDALAAGNTNAEEVEAIFRLTSLPTYEERFVVPPLAREVAVEVSEKPLTHKQEAGFGVRN